MATPPTIQAAKLAFLTAQINILTQSLVPSSAWQAKNSDASIPAPDRIPPSALDDAIADLNLHLQRHSRRVYPPQATDGASEQIDALYARETERRPGGLEDALGGLGREVDLTVDAAIEALPPQWETPVDFTSRYPTEARKYADSVARLAELRDQRGALRERVNRLRDIKTAIKPLEVGCDVSGIQENLITRGGELEKELERMRMLLARVTGRVHSLPEPTSPSKTVEDFATARKRGVEEFLADPKVFPA